MSVPMGYLFLTVQQNVSNSIFAEAPQELEMQCKTASFYIYYLHQNLCHAAMKGLLTTVQAAVCHIRLWGQKFSTATAHF